MLSIAEPQARNLLEKNNWNVDNSVNMYFENPDSANSP